MPVISVDYEDLMHLMSHGTGVHEDERELMKKFSPQSIADAVPRLGGDSSIAEGKLELEFFPNRPDLFSVEGIARALRNFLGLQKDMQTYPVGTSDIVLRCDEPSVRDVRPYIVGCAVKGIVMTDHAIRSIMDLQEKLHGSLGRKRKKVAIGVHDLDKVTPPFTYKGVEPRSVAFVPLQSAEKMDLVEILEKHDKGKAYADILKGKMRYPVIFDNNGNVLSFPPIINGALTALTEQTKNIFIDVTGTDKQAINHALNIIATSLAERGGKIESITLEYGTLEDTSSKLFEETLPHLVPSERAVELSYASRLLGVHFDADTAVAALQRLGFGIVQAEPTKVRALVPAYRTDILHEVDLVEDIAIGYGYERFPRKLPRALTFGGPKEIERLCGRLRTVMVGLGFLEVMTMTLAGRADQYAKMGLSEEETKKELERTTTVKNPLTEDINMLRTWLTPSLMLVLRANKHRDLPQRIFEIGDVVLKGKNRRKMAFVAIGSKSSFTEAKSLAEGIMRDMGAKFALNGKDYPQYIPGRSGAIMLKTSIDGENEIEIGSYGELSPRAITNFELGYPTIALEIDVELLDHEL